MEHIGVWVGCCSVTINWVCEPVIPGTHQGLMSNRMKILIWPVLLALLPVVWFALLSAFARRPAGLGATGDRLGPMPTTPNAVGSQTEDPAYRIAPLEFDGDPDQAWQRLRRVLQRQPRTTLVTVTDRYLHAEARSRLFRFTDDIEFLLQPEARQIDVRSASRVGHSDLGVNRARVEAIRREFAAGD
jgi:uncharacterized protein (DUF1499 family)